MSAPTTAELLKTFLSTVAQPASCIECLSNEEKLKSFDDLEIQNKRLVVQIAAQDTKCAELAAEVAQRLTPDERADLEARVMELEFSGPPKPAACLMCEITKQTVSSQVDTEHQLKADLEKKDEQLYSATAEIKTLKGVAAQHDLRAADMGQTIVGQKEAISQFEKKVAAQKEQLGILKSQIRQPVLNFGEEDEAVLNAEIDALKAEVLSLRVEHKGALAAHAGELRAIELKAQMEANADLDSDTEYSPEDPIDLKKHNNNDIDGLRTAVTVHSGTIASLKNEIDGLMAKNEQLEDALHSSKRRLDEEFDIGDTLEDKVKRKTHLLDRVKSKMNERLDVLRKEIVVLTQGLSKKDEQIQNLKRCMQFFLEEDASKATTPKASIRLSRNTTGGHRGRDGRMGRRGRGGRRGGRGRGKGKGKGRRNGRSSSPVNSGYNSASSAAPEQPERGDLPQHGHDGDGYVNHGKKRKVVVLRNGNHAEDNQMNENSGAGEE